MTDVVCKLWTTLKGGRKQFNFQTTTKTVVKYACDFLKSVGFPCVSQLWMALTKLFDFWKAAWKSFREQKQIVNLFSPAVVSSAPKQEITTTGNCAQASRDFENDFPKDRWDSLNVQLHFVHFVIWACLPPNFPFLESISQQICWHFGLIAVFVYKQEIAEFGR